MDKEKLIRFLKDRYSKDEFAEIVRHFERDDQFDILIKYLHDHWNELEDEQIPEKKKLEIQAKLHGQIVSLKRSEDQKLSNRLLRAFNRAAAVLLIPVLLVSVFALYQWKKSTWGDQAFAEIYCPLGTRVQFSLPDGSSGWLNSGSTLKYPVMFANDRQVELSGEAFFDVKKNHHSLFTVKTELFTVDVLGTSFNVSSYSDDSFFDLTLESGQVHIRSNRTPHETAIEPNQRFIFDRLERRGFVEEVADTRQYTSWKNGNLIFRNTPLEQVVARLERWYNVEFIFLDEELRALPYRAVFHDERLERLLELLTLTAPIEYEIVEPKELDDGRYEKRKIYLKQK